MRLGGLEAGGSKIVCLVGSPPDQIEAEVRFPTEDPATALALAVEFFRDTRASAGPIAALGIASFGPVELRTEHPSYGSITSTPKPGWSGTDLVGPLCRALGVPVGFDTDVNAAALAEGSWGAARGLETFVYMTVGTGIGVGAVVAGRPLHGLVHTELGHVHVPRQQGDEYPGRCPFHGDCLEGMACGPAVAERWGKPAEELTGAELDAAVVLEARYLGAGLRTVVYALAPERIVVGGGLASLHGLLPRVRAELARALAGYPGLPEHSAADYVAPAALGDRAGPLGALALAELAATS
jgi:fructokinase